jgi:glycosyltransferase involved in cell wall biosynthesis
LRALCITSSYPRDAADIAGLFVEEFCDTLTEGGIDVDVASWSDRGQGIKGRVTRVRYAPAPLETLFYEAGAPENLDRHPLRIVLALPAMLAMLVHVLRTARRYDVLIGHWLLPGGLVARVAGRWTATPSLAIGHSGGVHALARLPKALRDPMASLITSGPTAVISKRLRSKLQTMCGASQIHVIPMGVRSPAASDASRTRDWLFMGRLVPIKGVDIAIRAFAAAQLTRPARLHILGDGPLRDDLEKLARDLGAPVIFRGNLLGTAKSDALQRASFFLAPSRLLPGGREEGAPIGLLEGVLSGLVPIVGHMPAATPVIADPAAQIETSGEVDRWRAKIENLEARSDAEVQKLRDQGVSQASGFTWALIGPRWIELIADIADDRS